MTHDKASRIIVYESARVELRHRLRDLRDDQATAACSAMYNVDAFKRGKTFNGQSGIGAGKYASNSLRMAASDKDRENDKSEGQRDRRIRLAVRINKSEVD